MDSEAKNQKQRLKEEFDHAKKAFIKWNSLIQKREELECQIEKMQLGHNSKQELPFLKKRLRELDTLLDHLEEHSPEKIENLENQLVDHILSQHPELHVEYEGLQEALTHINMQLENLALIHKSLNNVKELLQRALEARQRVRRRGILSYIFGANPNQVISQHLHAIDEQIAHILPELNSDSHRDFSVFLIELQKECKQRWGFHKIDNFFGPASEFLTSFIKKMDEEIETTELCLHRLKQKRDDWINEKGENKG